MKAKWKTLLSASTAFALIPTAAFAQTAAPATPPIAEQTVPPKTTDASGAVAASQPSQTSYSGDQTKLEEIVVTATRRTVDLQRVPAVVEAVPASTLKAFNITGVLELPKLISGLLVSPTGGNNIFLRGIGSSSTGFNEAQTAVYIDGLYLANPTIGVSSFNNIDRIEVLKGPQGTLYGRNVTGGLISVTTRNPGNVLRVDGSIGYDNYQTLTANLYASTPISDTLAANIAVISQNQHKGWGINIFNGDDVRKVKENGVETKLAWTPTSSTKVTGSFIYDYNNRTYGYNLEVYPGTVGTDGTPYLGHYRNDSRIDSDAPTSIYIGTVKVEQDLGFANLMSLTGYQQSTADVLYEPASPILGQPAAGLGATYNNFYEHNRTYSQEFQLTSKPSSSRLDWVAGAFYYNDHTELRLDTTTTCIGNVCTPGFTPTRSDAFPNTLSKSVYGDGTYRFFHATKLTVGLRYTDERKTLSGILTPLPGQPDSVTTLPAAATATTAGTVYYPGQPFPGYPTGIATKLHFHKLTYRFVLAQDIGSNVHLYASHNLGFKSGAFNPNSFNNPPVRPELLYATETGMKTELFDRRLRLNLAYFHYTYKDVQLRSSAPPALPGAPILENAAEEKVDGVDGDFSIVAARGLVFNGSFEYLHARYTDFPGTTITIPGTRVVNGVLIGAPTTIQNANLAGYTPPYAPPFSATIGVTYTKEFDLGTASLSISDKYNVPYSLVTDNSIREARHHVVSVSLNLTTRNKRFDLNLFVRNLTNQYTYTTGNVSTNFSVSPGAPRTFGATVGFHY